MTEVWRPSLLALLFLASALTGCLGGQDDAGIQASETPASELVSQRLALLEQGGFEIDVPIDVVLVGFQPGVADTLQETLTVEPVDHLAHSNTRSIPPGSSEPVPPEDLPVPVRPRAHYNVTELPDAQTDAFFEAVAQAPVDEATGLYDANLAEDQLAELLPRAGIAVDPNVATFVLLHAEGRLVEDHGWRFTLPNGHLEPVRAFGERHPLLVYDVSARPDPYVVGASGDADVAPYNFPLEREGPETIEALEALTLDATHYRLLKGATFPVSTKPCHSITLLLAIHGTSVTEVAPGYRAAEDWVDLDGLEAAFRNATGDEVSVHLRTLVLPVDDPALAAVTRAASAEGSRGAFFDTMRWYLDEAWEQYAVVEPGCESYLNLLLYGDLASEFGHGTGGSAWYDVNVERRFTFSVYSDVDRFNDEGARLLGVGPSGDPTADYVNRVFSHETGHVFGLRHPQDIQRAHGPSPNNDAFQSVWSVMSYQVGERLFDYGAIDRIQFQMSRAGYIIEQAQGLGLEGTPAFEAALEAASQYNWAGVHDALEAQVHGDG